MCAPDLAEGPTVIFQETQSSEQLFEQESARLAALYATGILDTAPDPAYDAITRLAAEHFQKWACSNGHCRQVPRDFGFAASVPVRSQERHVLGSLTILCRDSKAGL